MRLIHWLCCSIGLCCVRLLGASFSGPETGKRTRVTRKADGKLTSGFPTQWEGWKSGSGSETLSHPGGYSRLDHYVMLCCTSAVCIVMLCCVALWCGVVGDSYGTGSDQSSGASRKTAASSAGLPDFSRASWRRWAWAILILTSILMRMSSHMFK